MHGKLNHNVTVLFVSIIALTAGTLADGPASRTDPPLAVATTGIQAPLQEPVVTTTRRDARRGSAYRVHSAMPYFSFARMLPRPAVSAPTEL